MKWFEIKYLRIILLSSLLLIIGNLSSQVFFLVTNSNYNEILPEGQSRITFENNELELIDWDLTGDASWAIDSLES